MTSIHKPILIVIAGPNGSGKTTITSRLLKSEWLEDAVYINPDNVAQEKFGNWNSPEAVINAAKYCEEWRERCLSEKRSLIFETVFSSAGKVEFVRRAIESGYFVRIFFISTESLRKVKSAKSTLTPFTNGHGIFYLNHKNNFMKPFKSPGNALFSSTRDPCRMWQKPDA